MGDSKYYYSDHTSVDKGWAWIVLLGTNLWNLIVSGMIKSFGVLYVELMVAFDSGPAQTGWLGSIFNTMMLLIYLTFGPTTTIYCFCGSVNIPIINRLFTPFAGYLGDKVPSRWIMVVGGVLASTGVFLTGLVPTLSWAVVTYSVMAGGAVGIMDGPVFSTLNKYFKKKRALANSVAFTGSGIGCLVMPLLIRVCTEYYTIRGTMFILSALWLHTLVIGALFRPIRLENIEMDVNVVKMRGDDDFKEIKCDITDSSSFVEVQEENNVKPNCKILEHSVELSQSQITCSSQEISRDTSKKCDIQEMRLDNDFQINDGRLRTTDDIQSTQVQKNNKSYSAIIKHGLKDYWLFLNNGPMLKIVLGILFGSFAYFNQIFLFPPLAEELGMSKIQGAFLVSLVGISEMTSRIPLGILCDKPFVSKPIVVSILSLFTCVIAILVSFVPLWEVLVAYACVTGILGGTIIPLGMPMLVETVPTAKIGSAAGLFLWAMSMAFAVGPPLLGAVKVSSGSYMHAFRLTVFIYIPSASFLLWGVIVKRFHSRKSQRKTSLQSKKYKETEIDTNGIIELKS